MTDEAPTTRRFMLGRLLIALGTCGVVASLPITILSDAMGLSWWAPGVLAAVFGAVALAGLKWCMFAERPHGR